MGSGRYGSDGDPQAAYPVIHLAGTNGKTSTSRMIDTLLRALDLCTGRFTSPHVERMPERIRVDGDPLSDAEFVAAFNNVASYTHVMETSQEHPLSLSEIVVWMAHNKFAGGPSMWRSLWWAWGAWDARNAADAAVAVVMPVAVNHMKYWVTRPRSSRLRRPGSSSRDLRGSSPSRPPTSRSCCGCHERERQQAPEGTSICDTYEMHRPHPPARDRARSHPPFGLLRRRSLGATMCPT